MSFVVDKGGVRIALLCGGEEICLTCGRSSNHFGLADQPAGKLELRFLNLLPQVVKEVEIRVEGRETAKYSLGESAPSGAYTLPAGISSVRLDIFSLIAMGGGAFRHRDGLFILESDVGHFGDVADEETIAHAGVSLRYRSDRGRRIRPKPSAI